MGSPQNKHVNPQIQRDTAGWVKMWRASKKKNANQEWAIEHENTFDNEWLLLNNTYRFSSSQYKQYYWWYVVYIYITSYYIYIYNPDGIHRICPISTLRVWTEKKYLEYLG